MKDKPVREKKNLDKGLKRSVGKPACCVSKGGSSSNTASLPDQVAKTKGFITTFWHFFHGNCFHASELSVGALTVLSVIICFPPLSG